MLDREQFIRLRANVKAYDNRAVFEIPEILEPLISPSSSRKLELRAHCNCEAVRIRNSLRHLSRTSELLTAASLLIAFALAVSVAARALDAGAGVSDFGGLQFKILSADGKQTIGATRFTVLRNDSTEEIKGETRYLDGERDSEDVRLDITTPLDAQARHL